MTNKYTIETLAKIEKAMEDQYGKESTLDPRSFWNKDKEIDYIQQVRDSIEKDIKQEESSEKIQENGFLLSKRLVTINRDVGCEVCKKYLLDPKDKVYISKFSTCFECFIRYVDGRESRWAEGWRPNKK